MNYHNTLSSLNFTFIHLYGSLFNFTKVICIPRVSIVYEEDCITLFYLLVERNFNGENLI